MAIQVFTAVCGAYQENAYLVADEGSDVCVLIDPGDDAGALRALIARSGRKPAAILLTHGHFDHMLGAQLFDLPVYVHASDAELLTDPAKCAFDSLISSMPMPEGLKITPYGEELHIAGMDFRVLHTPGHTAGSVCLYLPDEAVMFSGDTLFQAGFGRMDLYSGSQKAMRHTLMYLLRELPPEICVYPGHGPVTSIGTEKDRYEL